MRHSKRVAAECCEYGCEQPRFCYGRCTAHFARLDSKSYERLKRMTKAERQVEYQKATAQPARPRWEWLGDENTLAEMTAKLDAQNWMRKNNE